MTILQFGGGSAIVPVDYAIVSNVQGQVCSPVDPHQLVFDTITHLGNSFSAVVGDSLLHLDTGVYLAFSGVYVASGALGQGYVYSMPWSDYMVFASTSPCVAAAAGSGEGTGVSLSVATAPAVAWINSQHTDNVDRPLAGDLCVVRLGGV